MKKSVGIVDGNQGMMKQLFRTCERTGNLMCVGAYASPNEHMPNFNEEQPDVVVMNIKLNGMPAKWCAEEIIKIVPDVRIIITTLENNKNILYAFKAGANGSTLKANLKDQLLSAINEVCADGAPMFKLTMVKELSMRQRQIMDLLVKGLTYEETGNKLQIGSETVRTHIKSVCRKMRVKNRTEAIANYSSWKREFPMSEIIGRRFELEYNRRKIRDTIGQH